MRHRSIVVWPPGTPGADEGGESHDTHRDKESALAVCRAIERDGLGGDGKIFPLSTRVEPVEAEPKKD